MAISLKPLDRQVLVITGASSGIGLATAKLAARRGARVVLAARNAENLRTIEEQIRDKGGEAVHVVADVADRADVEKIRQVAIERFGGFDTWINDAGVSIWGEVEEVSEEDHRRLFDTNFWGVVHGSLVAAKHFRERAASGGRNGRSGRYGGAIINLGSLASDVALPLQVMYAASKHAVKGFTDGLRMELEATGEPVAVTLIKPAGIDTPFRAHARNYLKREPKLPPPVYKPAEVAEAILYAAQTPVRDIYVGGASRVFSSVNRIAPRLMDWVGEAAMIPLQQQDRPARRRDSNLHGPVSTRPRVRGDHPGYVMKTSVYTRAAMHPMLTSALLAAATVATAAAMIPARSRRGDGDGQGQRTARPAIRSRDDARLPQ